MALHCSECGFVNPEGANYCQKCGAYVAVPDSPQGDQTTVTFRLDETGEQLALQPEPPQEKGAARLVVRSGGGRAGESFELEGDRITIGRTPDSAVFLDDVTVSRHHALIVRRSDALYLDDLGSLNGTYVNRRRIESHRLSSGDEIQVGKYKLTYLES